MDMDEEKMKRLQGDMAQLSEDEKDQLRKAKEKEIQDLLDFENRPKKESTYKEMSMDEFIKHPLFMDPNHIPTQEEIDENEFLMAVQAMKYSDTDSPDVQAEEYKTDGTFHFKCKLYRKAILAYSKAIQVKPTDKKILSSCYNNRGAAEFFLKNYRKAITDSGKAVAIDSQYAKSWWRIFDGCEKLALWGEGLNMIEICIGKWSERTDEQSEKLRGMREKFAKKHKETSRDQRKRAKAEKEKMAAERELIEKIRASGVKLIIDNEQFDDFDEDPDQNRSIISAMETHQPDVKVHLNSDNMLVWPVMLVYPEHGQTDFIQEFAEDVTLGAMLTHAFEERPPWDDQGKYKVEDMNVWVENRKIPAIFPLDINAPLNNVLRNKNCFVMGGCPSFIITVAKSAFEASFKKKYHLL